jgi:beta-glucosidase
MAVRALITVVFLTVANPLSAVASLSAQERAAPAQPAEAFVDSILGLMTIEEKLGQLTQFRALWSEEAGGPRIRDEHLALLRRGGIGSFLSLYGADYLRELQRVAVEESRLGIPLLFAHDVIHGFRTIFPVPLAEAASWNPQAVEGAARIAAIEATAHGLHWTFAPMVDIARDPRWGRVVEGSGEDPHLGSVMAAARVRGFQGADLGDPTTLLACAKHYVAYGAAEGGRDYNIADISERTLREVYLPPFRAAVEAGVETVMGAFNEIAGVPMHANEELIDGVLRGEWGFEGVVISDFTAILELIAHGVAATRAEAGALAIGAGVDVDMESGIYGKDLLAKVETGEVSTADVDEAVRRVLRAKFKLGLFEDPYRYGDPARERASTLTEEHRRAAREIARESIVLLKNEGGALPLVKDLGRLAVIGPLADDRRSTLGSWAGAGRAEDAVTVLEGIQRAVSSGTTVRYAPVTGVLEGDTNGFADAVDAARDADAVVLVLGETQEMSAEAASRAFLDLPGAQRELAEAVLETGTPVVVVLMNGRPLAIPWLDEQAPAILEAWYLGVEMGNAVADVLFGDMNPSGKLPVTFPRALGQVPIYYAHKSTGRPPGEGKYTSKYIDVPVTPLYPFGHGLSYTDFAYRDLELGATTMTAGDTLEIAVEVANVGDRPGTELVQLYVQDEVGSITRPVKELRGFRRVALEPGESRTVTFALTDGDLAFWGRDMEPVVEPGRFRVYVGGSSADVLAGSFERVGERQRP